MIYHQLPENVVYIKEQIKDKICSANTGWKIKRLIEKDKDRYIKALKNIKNLNLENRITLIFKDALDVKLKEKFDLIIIDAAKSKNLDFFKNFEKNLEITGTIITDNLNFHGYVKQDIEKITSKNIRGLVKKIRLYIDFLDNNIKYKTKFYDLGDGISVTERRLK